MTTPTDAAGGECQCGNVRYRLLGKPLTFYICHCRDCQKQSSSAFGMSLWIRPADFELVRGQLKEWRTKGDSGAVKICAFCGDCGSRIYHAASDPGAPLSIKAGTLDDLFGLRPVAQLWTSRAHSWIRLEQDNGPVHEAEPENDDELVEAWDQSRQS